MSKKLLNIDCRNKNAITFFSVFEKAYQHSKQEDPVVMFLIHNKKTDEWISILDEKGRIRRRGHTNAHLSKTEPPRLFSTKQGANYAMKQWLKGRITVNKNFHGDWEDESEDWNVEKDPSRIAEDMEIRECEIVLK